MRAVLCYCAVVRSLHRGELQHLVGHGSTCDWCNTWTESVCFFPFSSEGLYGSVFVEQGASLDRTPPCWHASQFLSLPFCSLLFPGTIVSLQTWNPNSTPPMTPPILHHVPYVAVFPEGVCVWGGHGFIVFLFLWSINPPPPPHTRPFLF